jgi:excisionase family DNA binding protein
MSNQIEILESEELLDYRGASRFLDTPVGTLQVWISTKRYDLPFYKIGRKVRFKKSELAAWLAGRKRG